MPPLPGTRRKACTPPGQQLRFPASPESLKQAPHILLRGRDSQPLIPAKLPPSLSRSAPHVALHGCGSPPGCEHLGRMSCCPSQLPGVGAQFSAPLRCSGGPPPTGWRGDENSFSMKRLRNLLPLCLLWHLPLSVLSRQNQADRIIIQQLVTESLPRAFLARLMPRRAKGTNTTALRSSQPGGRKRV